jgi:hypothetical protein
LDELPDDIDGDAQGDAGEAAAVKSIEVVGTQFVVALANGQVIHSAELIGATLNIATGSRRN